MAITKEKFIRYSVLPGIVPRLRSFVGSGFSFLASLIAVIYYNVGLLPAGHEYLKPNNFGRYGIRHIVAEAGGNLVFKKEHIDQIVLYFTILIGLVLVTLQIILLIISFVTSPVMASSFFNMLFVTPAGHTPSQDIAFIVLDNIFGIMARSGETSTTGFFNSCISDLGTPCLDMSNPQNTIPSPTSYPLPMHFALHKMLYFYTMGIVFVSGLIIIYFIITIIGETVTSGTPFGQRFNKAWFIPRLIVFFALIAPVGVSTTTTVTPTCAFGICIPIPPTCAFGICIGSSTTTTTTSGNNAGINIAQLIVFSVAKFGSNIATNAWLQFNDDATVAASEFLGKQQSMLAFGNVPEVGGLTQFMHVVRMCMYAEKIINGIDVRPYIVRPHNSSTDPIILANGSTFSGGAAGMGGTTDNYLDFMTTNFDRAVEFSRYKTVILRFGHRNPPGVGVDILNNPLGAYDKEMGYVDPTCGEIKFEITSLDPYVIGSGSLFGIQQNYYLSIAEYLTNDHPMIDITSRCMVRSILPYDLEHECVDDSYNVSSGGPPSNFGYTSGTQWLTIDASRSVFERFNAANKYYISGEVTDWGSYSTIGTSIQSNIEASLQTATADHNVLMPASIRERGWAGAALWYNKIAEINGINAAAMQNLPSPFKYPKVMEQIASQHKAYDSNYSYTDRFNPRLQSGQLADLPRPGDQYIAAVLYNNYNFWQTSAVQEGVHIRPSKNSILDVINMIFGTQGLLNILENDGVHPLAMLSYTGKLMVDASLRNLFLGVVGQGIGQILDEGAAGKLAVAIGGFLVQFSLISLSIGFMLFYILPFMPFIYFFFAFGGWIKSIFEAVVAMPLWALAHIKIDGEGLPGPLATNGYFLLFEIFLRPTLIIFGFLISISLFAALVNTLHDVFHVLTLTATGYDLEAEIFTTSSTLVGGSSTMDYWRSPLDELFYTAIYTIIVYMIGLSCFKLIDEIPNNMMRWMGVTVSTFRETAGDPAGELSGKMYRATQMTNAQITQMVARIKGTSTGTEMTDAMMRNLTFK